MKLPISAIILTYNEEANIGDCLSSIHEICGEIFLVDSFSTDRTLEIAQRYTAKIYQHEFKNFAQQRNWAQDNLPLGNEWVMHLDADERISTELAKELENVFLQRHVDADGFMVSRKTVFRGRWIRFGGHYPVYHLRIFKKTKGRSEQRLYDQNYMVAGKVIRLKGDIINIINPDIASWKQRHRRWASLEAEEVLFNKERKLSIGDKTSPIVKKNWLRYNLYYKLPLFLRAFLYFFYRYIIRLGFLDGIGGAIFHFWHGCWYRMLVDCMIFKLLFRKPVVKM